MLAINLPGEDKHNELNYENDATENFLELFENFKKEYEIPHKLTTKHIKSEHQTLNTEGIGKHIKSEHQTPNTEGIEKYNEQLANDGGMIYSIFEGLIENFEPIVFFASDAQEMLKIVLANEKDKTKQNRLVFAICSHVIDFWNLTYSHYVIYVHFRNPKTWVYTKEMIWGHWKKYLFDRAATLQVGPHIIGSCYVCSDEISSEYNKDKVCYLNCCVKIAHVNCMNKIVKDIHQVLFFDKESNKTVYVCPCCGKRQNYCDGNYVVQKQNKETQIKM